MRRRDRISASGRVSRLARMATVTRQTVIELRRLQEQAPLTPERSGPVAQRWARDLLDLFHVDVEVHGAPALDRPGLLVSNHVSYLDIVVWLACAPCCFLSKSAVRLLPLVGPGATMLGTVYLDRDQPDSRRAAREALARAVLQEKRQVVVFPGGTTSRSGLPWRRGSFAVAQEHDLPVQAAALHYSDPGLIGWENEPGGRHLWDLLGSHARQRVEVELFAPIQVSAPEADALRLAESVREAVTRRRASST